MAATTSSVVEAAAARAVDHRRECGRGARTRAGSRRANRTRRAWRRRAPRVERVEHAAQSLAGTGLRDDAIGSRRMRRALRETRAIGIDLGAATIPCAVRCRDTTRRAPSRDVLARSRRAAGRANDWRGRCALLRTRARAKTAARRARARRPRRARPAAAPRRHAPIVAHVRASTRHRAVTRPRRSPCARRSARGRTCGRARCAGSRRRTSRRCRACSR